MNTGIAGFAWVTPLGADLESVWREIERGTIPEPQLLTNPETGRVHRYLPVPPALVADLARQPRLRRSSPISYYAVAAALGALADASLALTPELAARTAIVLAVSDGGVVYTRRFYEQIVKQGANAASPMLFPETVYNAPASHLAAQLGLDGACYTLVGDSTIGLTAMKFAEQLLALGDADRCVVVACEEIDWILCEAYHDWRLAATPLAEGAAALVLTRDAKLRVRTHEGVPFFRRGDAGGALDRVLAELTEGGTADLVVSCANGTFVDRVESAALAKICAPANAIFPRRTLGESPGASALLQVVAAAHAVRTGRHRRALVPVVGFNQQASGVVVEHVTA
jgi:hypothetical protein